MQIRIPLILLAVGTLLLGGAISLTRDGDHQAQAAVCFDHPPLGAIEPQRPEWCHQPLVAGIDTHQESSNAWVDDFNHGQSHAQLSPGYARGAANDGEGVDVLHFNHNDHWMADLQGDNGQWHGLGIAWMRPNRTFRSEAGKVVVEFEVAGPIAGTRGTDSLNDSWPEFTLTTDPSPGRLRANGTYLYETFTGHWTFGCRMQQSKHPICALYEPADGFAGGPTRQWEINQNGGEVTDEFGGGDHVGTGDFVDQAWKGCTSTQDPDLLCRNKFRVELTSTRVKMFANGVRIYEAGLIDSQLGNVLNAPGGFYVYFGDFAYRIRQDVVVRFHWDRLAINPDSLGETQPTNTPTPTSVNTNTPTSTPTATFTPTNTPTATSTSVTLKQCRQDIFERRNGSYVRISRVFYSTVDCIADQP